MDCFLINLKKYGGNMKNKLLLNFSFYALINLLLFGVLTTFNIIGILKPNYYTVNTCVYIFSSIMCIVYYLYIYKNYLINNKPKDCIIMLFITMIVGAPQIIYGLMNPGVHLAISGTWMGGLLSLSINNIILCLKNNKNLSVLSCILKIWINIVFPGMFIVGLSVVFFAEHYAVL